MPFSTSLGQLTKPDSVWSVPTSGSDWIDCTIWRPRKDTPGCVSRSNHLSADFGFRRSTASSRWLTRARIISSTSAGTAEMPGTASNRSTERSFPLSIVKTTTVIRQTVLRRTAEVGGTSPTAPLEVSTPIWSRPSSGRPWPLLCWSPVVWWFSRAITKNVSSHTMQGCFCQR